MAAKYRSSASVAVGQGVIGFGLVSVGVVATVATVLGFFGSTWWLFDFAANFRAHLAVVLVIVALLYALVFSKATGLFFMAVAAVNALVVLPLYTSSQNPSASDDTLQIVSFSVDQRTSIRDATFVWVENVAPDLVVLLDTTDDWGRESPVLVSYTIKSEIPIDRTSGIIILTPEAVETQLIRVSRLRDSAVRIEATIGDEPVAIYAVQARISSNQTDSGYRDEYLAEIGRLARAESIPTIVVGAFQATPWSHAFRDLVSSAELKNSLDGFGLQTTWPADRWAFFRLPIDHLLHSHELTTVDRYLGPIFGVEHRPIVVTVAMAS
ncbi:MAG: hypothetical protein QNL12_07310 [Acidimicrobiia bacterium]|nr:hypothetical protein [Acidimicrobiia bacterium]MDX2467103.1 hypothetical protein [Acidimicrobiia bacterium]